MSSKIDFLWHQNGDMLELKGGSSVTIDETGGRPRPVRRRLLKIEGTVEED
jgi:hypothetical protein